MIDTRARVKADGPRNAKLAVVGMAPAKEEVRIGRPFVGPSGSILNESLEALGIKRKDVFVTNVLEFPIPYGTAIRDVPLNIVDTEVNRLKNELMEVKPNCVFICGEEPLHYVTGKHSISKWRGSILGSTLVPGLKTVSSVHPAWILRGMYKWIPVFRHIDLKRAFDESKDPSINLPKRDAITGPSYNQVMDYLDLIEREAEHLAFDIETAWWAPEKMGHIACLGLAYRIDQALCIPFIRSNGSDYWTIEEEAAIWRRVASILQNHRIKKIAQNASFEWIYFWAHKIYPYPLWMDTMTAHHCLYPDFGSVEDLWKKRDLDTPGHSLAFINSQYTRTPYYKDDGKQWDPRLGDHGLWIYNCLDAMVTLDSGLQMYTELVEDKLWDFYNRYYIRPHYHSCRMEWFGVGFDLARRADVAKAMAFEIEQLQQEINATAGFDLNVASSKQMATFLYKTKGYQVRLHPKTKKPTADKDTLKYFAEKKNDPLLREIMRLRHLRDLKGDIVDQAVGADGRFRTHYKIGGTGVGGRWSSSKSITGTGTNLQNLPRDGIARELFIAVPGG